MRKRERGTVSAFVFPFSPTHSPSPSLTLPRSQEQETRFSSLYTYTGKHTERQAHTHFLELLSRRRIRFQSNTHLTQVTFLLLTPCLSPVADTLALSLSLLASLLLKTLAKHATHTHTHTRLCTALLLPFLAILDMIYPTAAAGLLCR